ncbi:fluoride efflux transporter FluC [Streptomyces sp. NPDC002073]|uniref:fluoride efflux transporter FluC n=1 Tax=Streptomyces sp. NBC_00239 TaxID=2903640 RepID=UPI002E2D471D|nr:CrcB family protein [Streptomyces sp. NBC_00239]
MTRPVPGAAAVDPDVDLHVPAQRAEPRAPVLAAVSAGGVLGALARYGLGLLWPAAPGAFPWTTLGINVAGCALIGVLMVLVGGGGRWAHPLVRPFLGTGVLGGFTTFSTYAVDFARLLDRGAAGTALAYAGLTVAGALGAVWSAAVLTRRAVGR